MDIEFLLLCNTLENIERSIPPWASTATLYFHCLVHLLSSSMELATPNIWKNIVLIFLCLFPLGSAQQTKYLQFSKQKGPVLDTATNYSTLSGQSLKYVNFTLCGSIQINFFCGYQSFYTLSRNDKVNLLFTLMLRNENFDSQKYTSVFIYTSGSSSSTRFDLRPHAWSHACTAVNGHSGHVTVFINGILVHKDVSKDFVFKENIDFPFSLILGAVQGKSPSTFKWEHSKHKSEEVM